MDPNSFSASKVNFLQQRLGVKWPSIEKAHADSLAMREGLSELFSKRSASDTSVVVFGSVARFEVTSKSDTDWILLVDGSATPEHKRQEIEVEQALSSHGYIEPGQSGVFGKFVGSHDLIHRIGGEDDLNSNTTRRVLLLLESLPLGNREAYDRVRRQILRRYLEDDRGLTHGSGNVRVPRFLLNDLTRYWRTVTVDFVYKQRADRDKKWALRNAKLRMSRKLVFAAGLLRCFFCNLDQSAAHAREALEPPTREVSHLLKYLEDELALSPLDTVAKACLDLEIREETALSVFDSYERFLAVLDDEEKRQELARAHSHEDLRGSNAWKEVREVTKPFHRGLVKLFLNDDRQLRELTMDYGLF
jgi:predicted nucleotidyltransferase